jgi:hypothetical protein
MHKTIVNSQVDKVLAVGILLGLLFAITIIVRYFYVGQLTSINHELELIKVKNSRVEQILNKEAELRKKFLQQRQLMSRDKLFLASQSPEAAASELQNGLKRLIARHSRAKVQTIKPIPAVELDNYSEISLEIRVRELSHRGLQNILFQVETHTPVLLIKELDLKRTQLNYKPLIKKAGQVSGLEATFVVSGLFRNRTGG